MWEVESSLRKSNFKRENTLFVSVQFLKQTLIILVKLFNVLINVFIIESIKLYI